MKVNIGKAKQKFIFHLHRAALAKMQGNEQAEKSSNAVVFVLSEVFPQLRGIFMEIEPDNKAFLDIDGVGIKRFETVSSAIAALRTYLDKIQ